VTHCVVIGKNREFIVGDENELLSEMTISKIFVAKWLVVNWLQDASIEYDDDQ